MSNRRLHNRHPIGSTVNGNGGRRSILCAAAASSCILAASNTRRTTMMLPRVACACAAYQYSPTTKTTERSQHHRIYHHHTKMVGFVLHRPKSLLSLPSPTHTVAVNRYHHQLWMTVDNDDENDVFIEAAMTNADAVTTAMASIPVFESVDETSSSSRQDTSDINEENDVILLPSMRAFTSSSSRSNIMISTKNKRRDNTLAVTPQMMGPSSSALLPSLSMLSSPVVPESDKNKVIATSWKERLVNVSNIASFLCILDCTLLPLFSVVMPALSWGAGAIGVGAGGTGGFGILGAILTYLPTLSHGIALYFVIPMGIVTSIINYYYGHGEWKFSLVSLMGLVLIFIANSNVVVGLMGGASGMDVSQLHHHFGNHHHAHDACGAMVGATTSMIAHTCPPIIYGGGEGLVHRLTNTLGCVFLLGSNYAGKKYIEKAKEDGASAARGCAASAFSEAWGSGGRGGEDGVARALMVCGCNDCGPTYGAGRASSVATNKEGGNFFQWKQSSESRR